MPSLMKTKKQLFMCMGNRQNKLQLYYWVCGRSTQ